MDTQAVPEINLSPVFAPIYWGFVISLLLGGMTIVQAYIYFPSRGDRMFVRVTAAAMLYVSSPITLTHGDAEDIKHSIFDMASSALAAQSIYYYLVPHFGSLQPLGSVTPSQLYFVHQLVNVKRSGTGSWIFVGLIVFFCFVAFAGGVEAEFRLGCVAAMYKYNHGVLSNRNDIFAIFFGIAKGAGALTDILATAAMCLFLESSKTGMNGTNSLLHSLMQFVIHRGALVTLIQVLLLVTFYAIPTQLTWFAFHVNVTKLYANTFFAMLNARKHLKEKHGKTSAGISSSGSFQMNVSRILGSQGRDGSRMDYGVRSHHSRHEDKQMDIPVTVTKHVIISEL
ncbi:hypothetical protein NP233_g4971 [Leucocoprinus birnbaumii]|uniref:DUF6534 domain-containing protein n=1 Tax=Leucocoprinus birnbaumii TaxID=56174 RepID=A0AAD5VW16_9AGAR|nr:hypothetical protein NP233_g4971 [Leucocoprinus birnbaumii]